MKKLIYDTIGASMEFRRLGKYVMADYYKNKVRELKKALKNF